MERGTFANIRIRNEMMGGKEGGNTLYFSEGAPSGEPMSIFDAAERYKKDGIDTVIVAGKEYGTGSSRDWAAKGPKLLGVRAVITESFERIHRSNLIGMGIAPFVFADGKTRRDYAFTGREAIDIPGLSGEIKPQMKITATIHYPDGTVGADAVVPDDPHRGRGRLLQERRHPAVRAEEPAGGSQRGKASKQGTIAPQKKKPRKASRLKEGRGAGGCPCWDQNLRKSFRHAGAGPEAVGREKASRAIWRAPKDWRRGTACLCCRRHWFLLVAGRTVARAEFLHGFGRSQRRRSGR